MNIKNMKKNLYTDLEILNKIIKSQINMDYIDWDFHLSAQNIEHHSLYHLNILDLKKSKGYNLKKLLENFILTIRNSLNFDENFNFVIFRSIGLINIKDVIFPLGIHWRFNEKEAIIYDDVGYKHTTEINKQKDYIFKAKFNVSDINWNKTFDMYITNDFMETEITLNDKNNPIDLKYKLKEDKEYSNFDLKFQKHIELN